MLIRAERPHDRAAVQEVHRVAFAAQGDVVAALVDDLRSSLRGGRGLSLVAVDGQDVVGHVLFTPNLLDAPRRLVEVAVLSPLAVLPARQGAGVGAALVREGVDTLARRGDPLVFLEGSPDYYPRFGFSPGGDHGFRRPSLRIPQPAFQVLLLPSYEPWMTGTLVYRQEFWEHDCVGLRASEA